MARRKASRAPAIWSARAPFVPREVVVAEHPVLFLGRVGQIEERLICRPGSVHVDVVVEYAHFLSPCLLFVVTSFNYTRRRESLQPKTFWGRTSSIRTPECSVLASTKAATVVTCRFHVPEEGRLALYPNRARASNRRDAGLSPNCKTAGEAAPRRAGAQTPAVIGFAAMRHFRARLL